MVSFANVGRYWRTLRHLRPVQLYGRLWFRFTTPSPDTAPAPSLQTPRAGVWTRPARRAQSLHQPRQFFFLNEAGNLDEVGWDHPGREKLWRYNQHYFDDLNAMGAGDRGEWHHALIADWIARNPPGQGSGWEPYPTSLRIVNWVKWALAGNDLPPGARHSLAIQARWLARRLEWHLLGNHLFANAKALVFAGLFFEGGEARGWLAKGLSILARQIPEQILDDGGQFELSPMYHALALEDVLDLVNLTRAFADGLSAEQTRQVASWASLVGPMRRWLDGMCHPDGEIAFFNDAAIAIAPAPAEIDAYARALGFPAEPEGGSLTRFSASGYMRLSRGGAVVIADVARVGPDYLPGHAHADTLSFELSLAGRRLVVNSGTSLYGAGAERHRQRSTAAHSTLVLDGSDSSEVWSGFRVARRARPFDIEVHEDGAALELAASHDGYRHLSGHPVHRRRWALDETGLCIVDHVSGRGSHSAEILFHLAPGISAAPVGNGEILLTEEATGAVLATVSSSGSGPLTATPSTWHPEFGISQPSTRLQVSLSGMLPLDHRTVFRWGPA